MDSTPGGHFPGWVPDVGIIRRVYGVTEITENTIARGKLTGRKDIPVQWPPKPNLAWVNEVMLRMESNKSLELRF